MIRAAIADGAWSGNWTDPASGVTRALLWHPAADGSGDQCRCPEYNTRRGCSAYAGGPQSGYSAPRAPETPRTQNAALDPLGRPQPSVNPAVRPPTPNADRAAFQREHGINAGPKNTWPSKQPRARRVEYLKAKARKALGR